MELELLRRFIHILTQQPSHRCPVLSGPPLPAHFTLPVCEMELPVSWPTWIETLLLPACGLTSSLTSSASKWAGLRDSDLRATHRAVASREQ